MVRSASSRLEPEARGHPSRRGLRRSSGCGPSGLQADRWLRTFLRSAEKLGEHRQRFVGVLLVNPVRTAIEADGLGLLQSGGDQLALQIIAERVLADDGKRRYLGQPGGIRGRKEGRVAIDGFVVHERRSEPAVALEGFRVARDVA